MDTRFLHRTAYDALTHASRVLIVSHPKPDGDTLGAASAMVNFCRTHNIPADVFCLDHIPEQYSYMPGTEEYTNDPSIFSSQPHDVLAVFDAGDLRYAGIAELITSMPTPPRIVNFDHHVTNERFGAVNVVDVKASSTAEVVYDFFRENGVEVSREMSICLLTGILTDTGVFSNAATTWTSLEAASDLLRRGAKIQEVSKKLIQNKTVPALRLWGTAFARLKHNREAGVASTAVFMKDLDEEQVDGEHADGISNFLNSVLDVKVVLVLKEMSGGFVKGSYRTTGDTDVSALAKALGGGGHKKAAGFTVAGRIVETALGWVVQ